MKIALYVEDGLEQIILTPVTDTETALLDKLHDGSRRFELHRGGFYPCMGGWMRHRLRTSVDGYDPGPDNSTMIVLRPVDEE
jgi:hypothetical protein